MSGFSSTQTTGQVSPLGLRNLALAWPVLHEEHIYPIERNASDGTQCAFCAPLTAALNSIVPAPRGSRHGEIQGIPGGISEASVNVGAGNAQHPGLLLQTRGNADQ